MKTLQKITVFALLLASTLGFSQTKNTETISKENEIAQTVEKDIDRVKPLTKK